MGRQWFAGAIQRDLTDWAQALEAHEERSEVEHEELREESCREDDDFLVGTDYLPTKGKIAVRSPRVQAAFGIAYDDGSLFAKLGGKYTGSQYSTFLDDERIPSFTELDAAIGYRLPSVDGIKNAEIRLNLINLTDASFLSGVANPTSNAQAATGVNGTSIPGSAPSYYIGTGFAALFTVSAGF